MHIDIYPLSDLHVCAADMPVDIVHRITAPPSTVMTIILTTAFSAVAAGRVAHVAARCP
jgi:hypothetical protein